jgi:hypothetical protein
MSVTNQENRGIVMRLPNKSYSDRPGFRTEGAEIHTCMYSETEDSETLLSIIAHSYQSCRPL